MSSKNLPGLLLPILGLPYFYIAIICNIDRNFVTCCSLASFKTAQEMLRVGVTQQVLLGIQSL
ncbi:MAG: hypothetical protein QM487_00140 [Candidatus Marithrix sp.]